MTPSLTKSRALAQGRANLEPCTLIACPDARPPAYQAAIGLSEAGLLQSFVTGFYHGSDPTTAWSSKLIPPSASARIRNQLGRRHDPRIPAERVHSLPSFDMALALEARTTGSTRSAIGKLRTRRFDRAVKARMVRHQPDVLMAFSDVASEFGLLYAKEQGIPSLLSMVHGEVTEEIEILEREHERSPEFFSIYLGEGPIDREALAWLHDRRKHDLEYADRVLVPSDHIKSRLTQNGVSPTRIDVIPYAADCVRFTPKTKPPEHQGCRFLFAGGISQRKGMKDLLDAWRLIKRPGWTLSLLGAMPHDVSPLTPYRDEFEWLGRVGHSEMPSVLADADVFVFPSLFEGSAVVTYEALACGLPSVFTAESGSVARDGHEGILVPAAAPVTLAAAMERLGLDPVLRHEMSKSARARAMDFDWHHYHRSLIESVRKTDQNQSWRSDRGHGFNGS